MDKLSLIGGLVEIKYPAFLSNLDIRVRIPLIGDQNSPDFSVSLPKIVFKALFYLGLASSVYYFYKLLGKTKTHIWHYLLSWFNSNRYLRSTLDNTSQNYTSVIYGATNKAGKAYSQYLAEKGFNIVMIDQD